MAVPVQTPFVEYIANGVTTNFPLGFDCETQSHLIVTVDDIEPITGSWSLLGGAVVFNSAPINGSKIIIKRNSPFERDRDFQLYDQSFRPPAVNLDLDRIWRKLQELGVMDWILGNRIDDLKNYVDDKDDELRAYLLEEIRKQGVALDQLDDYYNYLMQRLAQIAVDKGWDASFVVDGDKNQHQINSDQAKINLSIINYVNPKMFGAVGDGVADDTQAVIDCFNDVVTNGSVFFDYAFSKYKITQNIVVSAPNKNVVIRGNIKFISDTSYITFTGSISQIGNISVAANQNSNTVTINTPPSLQADDIIAIQNTRPFSFNAYRDYYYDGEIKEVKSVSGSDITFKSGIETSYPSGIEDKVFKISPITLDIDGVTFDCNGFAGLRIQLAANSTYRLNAYNKLNLTNASYGVVFDRCYNSRMIDGVAVKLGLGNTGTDYGIVISNCQDFLIQAKYAYGERHGCATGGADADGAIPNRRVYFENIKIQNSGGVGLHAADIHGNATSCHYENCDIKGMVGLGGEKCYSINNKITLPSVETRSPIFVTEASGEIGSIDDYFHDTAAATSIMGWASSVTGALNTKPYAFELRNAKIGKCSSLIGIMNATTLNNVDSKFIVDGFEFLESFSTVTRLVTYTNLNTSQLPSYVQITNPKNAIPESMIIIAGDSNLVGVTKRIYPFSFTNANGTYTVFSDGTMECRTSISYSGAVNTAYGTFFKQNTNTTWTFPRAFVQTAPVVIAQSTDSNVDSSKVTLTNTSKTEVYAISHRSYASVAVTASVVAFGRYLYV